MNSLKNDKDQVPLTTGNGPLLRLEQLADGALAEVEAVVDGDAESLLLHRDGDAVRAWFNICPHAGRRLDWSPGQFLRNKDGLLVCAAHGATFELQRGECVAGPCRGESLREVAVSVRDGGVWVEKGGARLEQDLGTGS
jgi:nitrite reductase/ring-hydroxylating ferredoxin subunit